MQKDVCGVCGKTAELVETGECIACFSGTIDRFGVMPYTDGKRKRIKLYKLLVSLAIPTAYGEIALHTPWWCVLVLGLVLGYFWDDILYWTMGVKK